MLDLALHVRSNLTPSSEDMKNRGMGRRRSVDEKDGGHRLREQWPLKRANISKRPKSLLLGRFKRGKRHYIENSKTVNKKIV